MADWETVQCAILHLAPGPHPPVCYYPHPAWVVYIDPQAGLRMNNVNGDLNTKKYIIETTGSGVAVIDYDHDGWPDIYLVNGDTLDRSEKHPSGHLYHTNRDGTF